MKLKTISIKGNEYVTVNERVKAFRSSHPEHSLITELINADAESCLFKASILDKTGRVIATGYAHELKASSYINKTSYIENCETSAIGRALGSFGIGIDSSYATADEVINAINQQQNGLKATERTGTIDSKILQKYNEEINELTSLEELKDYYNILPAEYKRHVQIKSIFSSRKAEING